MNYKDKYLKYKTKYLYLKNQIGKGKPTIRELSEACDAQIRTQDENCTECVYQYSVDDISRPVRLDGLRSTKQGCIPLDPSIQQIFGNTKVKYLLNSDGSYSQITNPNFTDTFLNTNYYTNANLHFEEKFRQSLNNDVICAEGNIVQVNNGYSVASTTVDSCMFVIIILGNGNKLCVHHTMGDGRGFGKMFDKSNQSDIESFIFSRINRIISHYGISSIYMCGATDNYSDIIGQYQRILFRYQIQPIIFNIDIMGGQYIFLVNRSNQVIFWSPK